MLDLWIAGTMRRAHGNVERLTARGVDWAAATAVATEFKKAYGSDPRHITWQLVEQFFGPSAARTADGLTYDLSVWPFHRYEWTFSKEGIATNNGFALVDSRRPSPSDVALLRSTRAFSIWEHTDRDVKAILGAPSTESGWWPEYTLLYEPKDGSSGAELTFDHGLLCAIDVRPVVGNPRLG
jgi:hypothetical protein